MPVVYVLGSSHSGSTLLALLGQVHPDMAGVGEVSIKPRIRREGRTAGHLCSCGRPVAACPFWNAVFARVQRAGLQLDAQTWTNDYRFEHPLLDRLLTRETSSVLLRRLRRSLARSLPPLRRRAARVDAVNVAMMRAVLAERRARVFLDTTKLATRLEYLLDVPALDVRVVWLTRDPRGVAWSGLRRGLALDQIATVWKHDQETAVVLTRRLPDDRVLHLRYEDLCHRPGPSLAALWTFAGLEPIAWPEVLRLPAVHVLGNQMRAAATLEVRQDEAWRHALGPADQARVLELVAPLHTTLGYSDGP